LIIEVYVSKALVSDESTSHILLSAGLLQPNQYLLSVCGSLWKSV